MKGSISIILGIRKHLITINLKHFFRNIPFSNRGLFAPSKDFPRLPGSDDDDDDDNNAMMMMMIMMMISVDSGAAAGLWAGERRLWGSSPGRKDLFKRT